MVTGLAIFFYPWLKKKCSQVAIFIWMALVIDIFGIIALAIGFSGLWDTIV